VQGGSTEVKATRLGYWQRRIFPLHDSDQFYTIEPKYDRKPWLLANDKYQDVELMWVILQYNTILDIDTEFVVGKVLRLPTSNRLFMDLLSRPPSNLR
jgi:hypothetical protein